MAERKLYRIKRPLAVRLIVLGQHLSEVRKHQLLFRNHHPTARRLGESLLEQLLCGRFLVTPRRLPDAPAIDVVEDPVNWPALENSTHAPHFLTVRGCAVFFGPSRYLSIASRSAAYPRPALPQPKSQPPVSMLTSW